MIPILFDKTETVFASNGIGRLPDALSCIVTEERNGSYELKMVYPITGVHYAEIAHSRIIFAQPAEGKMNQAFRIYKITKPANGKITVLAQHISYQLNSIPVSPFEATAAADALAGLVSNAAAACPFSVWTDVSDVADFKLATPESFKAAIGGMTGSILETYGGEMEWDMYTVRLHTSRGQDRGKIVSYGKNITSIQQEENISKVITGIYPYYKGDEYVELPEKVITVATTESYAYQRIEKLDMSKYFGDTPTVEELRTKAQEYIAKTVLGVPQLTIKASFVEEENHVPVYLCDTIKAYYAPIGIAITAKVTKIEYNVLLERYETITVGTIQDSIVDAIISQEKNATETDSQIRQVAQTARQETKAVEQKVEEITYDYVEPQVKNTSAIADGGAAIVMSIYFELAAATKVRFCSTMNFQITPTAAGGTANLNITYGLDDGTEPVMVQTYEAGYQVLTLDYLTRQLSAGSHVFSVAFGMVGGALL